MKTWLKILGTLVGAILLLFGAAAWSYKRAADELDRPALADCAGSQDSVCDSAFEAAGLTIDYRLIRPDRPAEAKALLVLLHGAGLNGPAQEYLSGRPLLRLANDESILVLVPSAGGDLDVWKDGENANHPLAQTVPDQAPALTLLIQDLSQRYGFDRRNVVISGYSNGGTMAMRMACEAAVPFAAVGSYGSPASRQLLKNGCAHATPALINHGTADGTNRFDGGYASYFGLKEVREAEGYPLEPTLSAAQTIEFWRSANGCTESFTEARLPDNDPNDGTITRVHTYTACSSAKPVSLAIVENGSHTIPGDRPLPFVINLLLTGKHAQDYSGHRILWNFAKPFFSAPD
ncbi:MAG: dienelactone hydrolase family protein [Pseudomonadota bacterium]